jgi:Cft2 family RNA processing exonuclease
VTFDFRPGASYNAFSGDTLVKPIQLTVLGGGSEIGANSYLLASDENQVVLDCGTHPKKQGPSALPDLSPIKAAPEAVVVSHAHIDHCGGVPFLLKHFPSMYVYATKPTIKIMDRMLHNSVAVMQLLAREQGIAGYPLYTHGDVDFTMRQSYGLELDEEFVLTNDSAFRCEFRHAGHVLGSASVLLRAPEHTVFYTGDVCLAEQELMDGHTLLDADVEVDSLIIECTRGAQEAEGSRTYAEEIDRFADAVARVLKRGGVALVPSFALGRSQELLNIIARLQRSGRLPDVPVYASGLGRAVYEIYSRYTHFLRPEADLRPLFEFDSVGDVWNPQTVRDLVADPCIIVATSGMMVENTPSAMIATEIVREKRNGIFFVGYLDPDTLGYKLLHADTGEKMVFSTKGAPVEMVLEDRRSFSFSAHASRADLSAVIEHINPKNVVFVHGDPEAVEWMSENCKSHYRKFTPRAGETVTLEA